MSARTITTQRVGDAIRVCAPISVRTIIDALAASDDAAAAAVRMRVKYLLKHRQIARATAPPTSCRRPPCNRSGPPSTSPARWRRESQGDCSMAATDNATMTDARALFVLQVRRFERHPEYDQAYDHIAARLRGESAQGEQQAAAGCALDEVIRDIRQSAKMADYEIPQAAPDRALQAMADPVAVVGDAVLVPRRVLDRVQAALGAFLSDEGWTQEHMDASDALDAAMSADPAAPFPVITEIECELQRAVAKFPTWPTDPLHASGVVMEEMGELAKAVLQAVYEPHKSTHADVRSEAIQTAAMAIRFVQSLDAGVYSWTP